MADVDYSAMTEQELRDKAQELIGKGDWTEGKKVLTALNAIEKAQEAEKKAEAEKGRIERTQKVLAEMSKLAKKLFESEAFDNDDGVWFAWDRLEVEEKGINPACRLVKTAKRASTGGTGSGSYKAGYPPSEEMLKVVGDQVMFAEAVSRTIDKVETAIPAGTTYRQAFDLSTNGGWRNTVRMAIGKAFTANS